MSDTPLVVVADIPFGSVYAYRYGDRIEPDAVERNGWQDYVKSVNSKEGRKALGLPEPERADTSASAAGKDK